MFALESVAVSVQTRLPMLATPASGVRFAAMAEHYPGLAAL